LISLLTVEEILAYYARIKGIPRDIQRQVVEEQIQELNLENHRGKLAETLSGGNKRKLSVAVALIGNPPFIMLDEPSAGMDPKARRFLWTVIANKTKKQRSLVVLTTHSMEEAEALSTKMGIMVRGGIFKCIGSSQHLKNKFGKGFEIEITIKSGDNSKHE
jgi:ATP-binding cassette subfamily A (ABC1) protein 3